MIKDTNKNKKIWDKILNSPPSLTEEEAKGMENIVKKLRKEHGFRKKYQ